MRMKPQQGRRGEKQKNTVTAIDRCQASCAPVGRTYISYQHRIESSSLDNPNRSQATHTSISGKWAIHIHLCDHTIVNN